METMMPRVSIILPTYNAQKTLKKTIDSVREQTFSDWELLILDDASTDDTVAIARECEGQDDRIRVIVNSGNQGVAATRNRGIQEARGEYVAFLDSDDTWLSGKLERQIEKLEESGADLCYTSYAIVNLRGEKLCADYIVPERVDFASLLCENVIGCSTVFLRTALAQTYPFDAAFYHEDYFLWLRLLRAGCRAVGCEEVLASWCCRKDSRSHDKIKGFWRRWAIYRKGLRLSFPRSLYCSLVYAAAGLKKYKPI